MASTACSRSGDAFRRRVSMVAEAVLPVKPVRVPERADERRACADKDGNLGLADFRRDERVPRRLFERDIAGDGRQG